MKKTCDGCRAITSNGCSLGKKTEVVRKVTTNHPPHYGGADNAYEAIKVIEAWGAGFHLGNVLKYISRAGKKDASATVEDLKKAQWYLEREVQRLERETTTKNN